MIIKIRKFEKSFFKSINCKSRSTIKNCVYGYIKILNPILPLFIPPEKERDDSKLAMPYFGNFRLLYSVSQ
jgi:hypothetical protein